MSIFDGNGLSKVEPVNVPDGVRPVAFRKYSARDIIRMFEFSGKPYYSRTGESLWVIITYCIEKGYDYKLTSPASDSDPKCWSIEKVTNEN
jgi:hypothetical protein